jgi:hypothetical protein
VEQVFVLGDESWMDGGKSFVKNAGICVFDEDSNLGWSIGAPSNTAYQVREASTDKPIDVGIVREDFREQTMQAGFGRHHGRSFASSR